jgi:hypothetical protein
MPRFRFTNVKTFVIDSQVAQLLNQLEIERHGRRLTIDLHACAKVNSACLFATHTGKMKAVSSETIPFR